jgi:hypothetical protein
MRLGRKCIPLLWRKVHTHRTRMNTGSEGYAEYPPFLRKGDYVVRQDEGKFFPCGP